jgi:alanine racemase
MVQSHRPSFVRINLHQIIDNYRTLKAHAAGRKCLAVLKANAYGHGMIEVAGALEQVGLDYGGVALVEEGIVLRQAGIKVPLLVFGGLFTEQIESYANYDLEITASSIEALEHIHAVAERLHCRIKVQLKIDTGMGRIGMAFEDAKELFAASSRLHGCDIRGVYSHLATAEEDAAFCYEQIRRFRQCQEEFQQLVPTHTSVIFHLANSAGMLLYPESLFDMVRPGLSLYGVRPPGSPQLEVHTAFSVVSRIVYSKVVPQGTPISYGSTWKAPSETRIVTVPVGYGDGYFRRLSNRGSVLIGGKRYPIVGRVCMDQLMVDVGSDHVSLGDEVVLIGSQGGAAITIDEIAALLETTPHEVFTSFQGRLPRIYTDASH